MAILRLFPLIVCIKLAYSQQTSPATHNGASGTDAKQMQELRLMVQTLQTQTQALQAQIAAIHSTLLTQQTMSIDEVCQAISNQQTNGGNGKFGHGRR